VSVSATDGDGVYTIETPVDPKVHNGLQIEGVNGGKGGSVSLS